ncbi:bifunctional metallophosphatase/5'-nucleotidase [Enterococcus sp. LJL98]
MEISILATSDLHGYLLPTNFTERKMDLPFGVARIATKMKEIEAEKKGPVIKIENGDFIQGSPLSYYVRKKEEYGAKTIIDVLNRLKYDVSVLGNHEFNYGLDYLESAIASYQHPVLAANILNKAGEVAFGQPYTILEKAGIKIAVLGLVTCYIPHWEQPETIRDLTFESIVETAKTYVPLLREKADVVLVAYHGGFERDLMTGEPTEALTGENEAYALLQEVPGIDALITGHQHREIATKIHGVPVIQPGFRGAFLGEIRLTLEKSAKQVKVIKSEALLHSMAEVPLDRAVLEQMMPLSEEVEEWLDQTLGEVIGEMTITDPNAARLAEHPYIEFINHVQMAASGADISLTSLFNNDGQGFAATITMRDVLTNYIYPNTLCVLEISGADLKAALEQTATYFLIDKDTIVFNPQYIEPKPQYYNYDMYEGIDYVIDLTRPFGERVTRLEYQGKKVAPNDRLQVVMNQYRGVGGGNYAMFSAEKIIKEIPIDMTELISDYLRQHPKIYAKVNHNFVVEPKMNPHT